MTVTYARRKGEIVTVLKVLYRNMCWTELLLPHELISLNNILIFAVPLIWECLCCFGPLQHLFLCCLFFPQVFLWPLLQWCLSVFQAFMDLFWERSCEVRKYYHLVLQTGNWGRGRQRLQESSSIASSQTLIANKFIIVLIPYTAAYLWIFCFLPLSTSLSGFFFSLVLSEFQ